MTKEEREKVQNVVSIVKEAAKTQAYEVAGAVAGDCAGDSVVIAVRSSIRRALIVQKRSGLGPKVPKKKAKKQEDVSTSSSESDTEVEEIGEDNASEPKKGLKKRIRVAAKNVAKLAAKEVTENFGKLAGKWAAQAVRQTMIASMKQCVKASLKKEKKGGKKEEKRVAIAAPSDQQPMAMEVSSGTASQTLTPLTMAINNVQIYPEVADQVPLLQAGPEDQSVADDQAILDAITAFKNMGFVPDEKLVNDIRKAKGDITVVFDNMRK